MADYGKHYLALGLRPGATQKEIQSAFRRMAKLYHPDQDSSLDGKMRYLEARQAYDVLRERRDTQPPKPTPPPNPDAGSEKATTCGSGWYSYDDDEYVFEDDRVFDFEKFEERIPFSLEEAPEILRKSIEEIAGVGMYIRVLLHVAAMWVLFSLMGYGVVVTLVVISCSLVGFAFFRYYFSSDPTSYIFANFVGSFLYSAVLSYLLLNALNSLLLSSWYVVAIAIMCALLLLWARPLTWIARAFREISSLRWLEWFE